MISCEDIYLEIHCGTTSLGHLKCSPLNRGVGAVITVEVVAEDILLDTKAIATCADAVLEIVAATDAFLARVVWIDEAEVFAVGVASGLETETVVAEALLVRAGEK